MRRRDESRVRLLLQAGAVLAAAAAVTACRDPLHREAEQALRDRLAATHRAYSDALASAPTIELRREPSDVEQRLLQAGRVDQLDAMSGPTAYENQPLQLGADLFGQTDSPTLAISLQKTVELTVRNNLSLQQARLLPAVSQTVVTQAEAVFDAVYFATFDYSNLDTPGAPVPGLFGGLIGGDRRTRTQTMTTGIRKPLTSGGVITAQTDFAVSDVKPANTVFDPVYTSSVMLGLSQPLLRGFGKDVATAPLELAVSAQRSSVQDFKATLLDVALAAEAGYWELVAARQELLIALRLLERTIEDRDRLVLREEFDVSPVRITEANSFVELRRADVIRARNQVRITSDRLKTLVNNPELPVSSEALLLPVDAPADLPVAFSLLDAATTALRNRPDAQKALLAIQDASVRQRVADNLRLPQLDLSLVLRYSGLSSKGVGESYSDLAETDYIDYLVSAEFSMPLGNREREAAYLQRRLERQGAVINYQRTAQAAVLAVKETLRDLQTAYELIGATRAARRAAADSLRAIEEQERAGVALTPEFLLDLKLSAQQRLAEAETQEIRAVTGYNTAVARLYHAMGTLLTRNHIVFRDEPEDDGLPQ